MAPNMTTPPRRPTKRPRRPPGQAAATASWTFLTNHAHVLLCVAAESTLRIRDLADRVSITERAVQRIITELEVAGYLIRQREGRRNVYRVQSHLPLRHPVEQHRKVAALITLILGRD
jgi:DNA-binding IclR family transcriptional regulator